MNNNNIKEKNKEDELNEYYISITLFINNAEVLSF